MTQEEKEPLQELIMVEYAGEVRVFDKSEDKTHRFLDGGKLFFIS